MPRYNLQFRNATWLDRQFINLTRVNDDGSAQVLSLADGQMSFGNYAAGVEKRELEFTDEMTTLLDTMMGEDYASEELFRNLVGEDIFSWIIRDKQFLEKNEKLARSSNHPELISAAMDLKRGICAEMIPGQYPFDYRRFVMKYYFEHLLKCQAMRVNADPQGMFTLIHYGSSDSSGAGVNDLNITMTMAFVIRLKMNELVQRNRFLGQEAQYGMGYSVRITEPSAEQIHTVESIFDLAEKNGFFPTDSQAIIKKAWAANCAKLSKTVASSATSSWAARSPTLLSAPSDSHNQVDIARRRRRYGSH